MVYVHFSIYINIAIDIKTTEYKCLYKYQKIRENYSLYSTFFTFFSSLFSWYLTCCIYSQTSTHIHTHWLNLNSPVTSAACVTVADAV